MQNRPRIARGRDFLYLDLRDVDARARLADIEQRRFRGDGDRLRHRRIERHGHVGVRADADADAGAGGGTVTSELRLQGVGTADPSQRDGHSGKNRPVLRLDLSIDVTGLVLRKCAYGNEGNEYRDQMQWGAPFHSGSFLLCDDRSCRSPAGVRENCEV